MGPFKFIISPFGLSVNHDSVTAHVYFQIVFFLNSKNDFYDKLYHS